MTVFNPSDADSTSACARMCLTQEGPCYVRMEKGLAPALHAGVTDFERGLVRLLDGGEVVVLSTGLITSLAFEAAKLLRDRGVDCGLVEVFRLKPLAAEALWHEIKDACHVVVVEEQPPIGGLRSVVGELPERVPGRLWHFCLPEEPSYIYGSRDWIRSNHGLDAQNIFEQVSSGL